MVVPLQASKIQVSGQLTTNTVWKADTVIIQGSLVINDGVTLTIAPGVEVLGGKIEVHGNIKAIGTKSEMISFGHFYRPNLDTELFKGLNFTDIDAANDSSEFEYCKFESLGIGDALFIIRNSNKIAILNSYFNGVLIRNQMLLSAFNSDVVFAYNTVKHFKERAVEFAGGNAICSYNLFDSCLNYRYGQDLVYFGAGRQFARSNVFSHCGDSLYPSDVYPTVIFKSGSECDFEDNKLLNSWNLALRIEDGSAPRITGCLIQNVNEGILLSKTHATKRIIIFNTELNNIAETGIYAGIDVRANLVNSRIVNCKKGGVTVVRDCDFKFLRDTFINNTGAGCNIQFTTTTAEFEDCYFEGNSANYGGGLFIADRASAKVNGCTFKSNTAVNGGGIAVGSSSAVQNCIFEGNEAFSFGGGAFVQGCTFTNNRLINNKAYMGGGALFQMSNYFRGTYEDNYIANNTADSLGGGALIAIDRYMKFRNNHIENNSAGYAGGGLSVYVGSKSWMSGNMINNNEAPFGAGINFEENTSHNLKLSNMSVLYNRSANKYAAMRNKSKDELYFTNCVFWGNESDNGLDFYSEWDNADPGFDHCVIQGGFSNFDLNGGTFNGTKLKISTDDPAFNKVSKAGIDSTKAYSYYFLNSSELYNGGKADTTKLRLLKQDFKGISRIKDNRIDIGAMEYVAPPILKIWQNDSAICQGSSFSLKKGLGSTVENITWYKDGKKIDDGNSYIVFRFTKEDAGKYWAKGVNNAGETFSDTVEINFIATPPIKLNSGDTNLCVLHSHIIEPAGDLEDYFWNTGETTREFSPKISGEIWLNAKDKNTGCYRNSDTIDIRIIVPSVAKSIVPLFNEQNNQWSIRAQLESNNGYDSIFWNNHSALWTEFSTSNEIKVDASKIEGYYLLKAYLNSCEGKTSDDFSIILPSTRELKQFDLNLTQNKDLLSVSTELSGNLQLQLYTTDGKEIENTQFINQAAINVANYRNQILLIKVSDAQTNRLWIDKIFIN